MSLMMKYHSSPYEARWCSIFFFLTTPTTRTTPFVALRGLTECGHYYHCPYYTMTTSSVYIVVFIPTSTQGKHMELIIAIPIALIILVVAWNLRRAFFNQSAVWKEQVDIATRESSVDLQADYKALHEKVQTTRTANGDKWFKMSDIEELMK